MNRIVTVLLTLFAVFISAQGQNVASLVVTHTDPKQAHEWQLRVNEIDTLLLDKLARWDELESRAS